MKINIQKRVHEISLYAQNYMQILYNINDKA